MQLKSFFVCAWIVFLLLFRQMATGQDISLPSDSLQLSLDSLSLSSDSLSLSQDSIKTKSNAIDAPVNSAAKDSMVMLLDGKNMLYLYGEASVQYSGMNLEAELIEIDANDNLIYATFGTDSIGQEFGYPYFKQGDSEYDMKKVRYNFKTEKMFITDVITQQGEGFISGGTTKKMPNDDLHMRNVKYTTCDDPDCPHYYFLMTKGKVRPKKNVIAGPTYLVIEDVPMPFALPFGFFPFTNSDYASGIIMPSYGDEMTRGFSLRDGGYYFAFNDHIDMALTGEIYTKGSWGLSARSTYRKRYKYSGNFSANYLVTKTGEKGDPDYTKATDFKVVWGHTQDAKANPFSTFSVNVNFSTSTYDRNQESSIYSPQYTQDLKQSSISWNYRHPNSPFSFRTSSQIRQSSKEGTVSVTLPNLTVTMSERYPFKRKEQIGDPRWYEKIRVSYTGVLSNSISGVKEGDFFNQSLIKDWKNGMKHSIPISASFNLLKHITVTPSINYNERWYTNRIEKAYSSASNGLVASDTIYGFHRVYDYSGSISASTKLYGMYKPWSLFGKWTKGVQIRHVLTPSVSFSGSPDFSDPKYGIYKELTYFVPDDESDPTSGNWESTKYSMYSGSLFGAPGEGKSGTLSFRLENNLEMKIPIAGTDSARKISLIDNLGLGINHNFMRDSLNWSDIDASIRLKLSKSFTLNLRGSFETYTYNYYEKDGKTVIYRQNKTWWEDGKLWGRLSSTSTSFSYNINNQTFSKLLNLFRKEKKDSDSPPDTDGETEEESGENSESGENADRSSPWKKKGDTEEYDSDGYVVRPFDWNLSISYSMALSMDRQTDRFNKKTRQYPYKTTQSMSLSGSIKPTKGWNFTFNSSYDFDAKKFAYTSCSITREMHCWNMSANFIPIGPYKSYSFTIRIKSSILQDVKYSQSSSYRDALQWGD